MFVSAIEIATQFTRPIYTIERFYGSTEIHPSAASLFFVNSQGWALTCKHVANIFIATNQSAKRKKDFENDLAEMRGKKKEKQILRELEQKYQLSRKTVFEIKSRIVNCIEGEGTYDLEIIAHPTLDVALLHFKNFTKLLCATFPIFPKDTANLGQGKFLCRLGFPFPEFTNFEYIQNTDTIDWTTTGRTDTPIFPLEGMLTRHLASETGQIMGFELSTPGLRGQSGGPAFDMEGKIWGMQFATNHLDLNFDVNIDVIRNGQKKNVHDSAFLHVGHCTHIDVLKAFMQQNNVLFLEQ